MKWGVGHSKEDEKEYRMKKLTIHIEDSFPVFFHEEGEFTIEELERIKDIIEKMINEKKENNEVNSGRKSYYYSCLYYPQYYYLYCPKCGCPLNSPVLITSSEQNSCSSYTCSFCGFQFTIMVKHGISRECEKNRIESGDNIIEI